MKHILLFAFLFAFYYIGYSDSTEDKLSKGIELIDIGKFDEAINQLTIVIENNSENSTAYCYRGLAFSNLGKYEDAIFDLDLAIYIDNKNAKAFFFRGLLKYENGRKQGYSADLKRAMELVISKSNIYYSLLFTRINLIAGI